MSQSNTILVTGGCGFVGRHLVRLLLSRGDSVWIVDNLFTGVHPDTWLLGADWKRSEEGSLVRYARSGQEVSFVRADAVLFFNAAIEKTLGYELPVFAESYHLASIVGGRALIDGDPLLVSRDLAIDAMFFAWVTRQREKAGRVLYASSSAAYPTKLQEEKGAIALKEEYIDFKNGALGQPDMTYGWTKLTGEYLARLAHERYGVSVACVRPFSGYGEDQDMTYPFPSISARVARHENPIEVWGTGEQARDFVHIDDCVDAMTRIVHVVSDGSGINIGSGVATSFNQLIRLLCEVEGYDAPIKPLVDKPVGVSARYADTSVLRATLPDWQPKISLREGAARVLRYLHEKQQNGNDTR